MKLFPYTRNPGHGYDVCRFAIFHEHPTKMKLITVINLNIIIGNVNCDSNGSLVYIFSQMYTAFIASVGELLLCLFCPLLPQWP